MESSKSHDAIFATVVLGVPNHTSDMVIVAASPSESVIFGKYGVLDNLLRVLRYVSDCYSGILTQPASILGSAATYDWLYYTSTTAAVAALTSRSELKSLSKTER